MSTDVHFWVEVQVGAHHWMTLDPTPGYVVLAPPLTLVETILQPVIALCEVVACHPWLSLTVCIGLYVLVLRRVVIADVIDEVAWRFRRQDNGRDSVVRMLGLLERRCVRAGVPRPRSVTPSRWLAEVSERMSVAAPVLGPQPDEIMDFVRLADQALYAPAFAGGKTQDACRSAGRVWSLKRLMALTSPKRDQRQPNARKHLAKELS